MLSKALATVLFLAGYASAVAVNPLPAPQSMTWGTSGPIAVNASLQFNGSTNDVVWAAWQRAWQAMVTLQWVPVAIEAPIPTFEPFPGATVTPYVSDLLGR